jgi:hypothetical protein
VNPLQYLPRAKRLLAARREILLEIVVRQSEQVGFRLGRVH